MSYTATVLKEIELQDGGGVGDRTPVLNLANKGVYMLSNVVYFSDTFTQRAKLQHPIL